MRVPALQRRGVYKTEYAPGTLREKLFGEGPGCRRSLRAAGIETWASCIGRRKKSRPSRRLRGVCTTLA